ncbi:expressed unknown protein [Seminavis robusta]|uniref:Uncharacterized protein n=1 Tax=Seminavis robusta TaxID=568900 RepID=A0A9N8EZ57_9STRA|nr:expressed unknown protein [Seminavis robusta]|eukprot:Sro1990_g309732.1  (106) ;mRNA; r:14880-15197
MAICCSAVACPNVPWTAILMSIFDASQMPPLSSLYAGPDIPVAADFMSIFEDIQLAKPSCHFTCIDATPWTSIFTGILDDVHMAIFCCQASTCCSQWIALFDSIF